MKRFVCVFLILCMIVSLICVGSFSVSAATSGTIGNCKWSLDGTVLTISGNGKIDIGGADAPWGKSVTELRINEGITSIGAYAFGDTTLLNKITLPSTLKEIDTSAFYNCNSLTVVVIPEGVTTIGNSAFAYCYELIDISLPKSLLYMGTTVFSNCDNLNNISVHEKNPAFSSVGGVLFNKDKSVLIKYPAKKIGNHYTVPDTVKEISMGAFEAAWNLFTIELPDGITKIGLNAFFRTIPIDDSNNVSNGCVYLGDYMVSVKDTNMTHCTVREGTKIISDGAFVMAKKLEKVALPEGLTRIGDYAFSWCWELRGITIPRSVKEIGESAFYDCQALKNVYYAGSKSDSSKIKISMQNNLLIAAAWKYNSCYSGTEHKWRDPVITKNATCTRDGEKQTTCAVCSLVLSDVIDSVGHNYEQWSQVNVPTCVQTGKEESRCVNCGQTATRTISALGHVYTPWSVEIQVSCEDVGVEKRSCTICQTTEAQNIEPKGHNFVDWEIYKKPSWKSYGEEKRTCLDCELLETRIMAPNDDSKKGCSAALGTSATTVIIFAMVVGAVVVEKRHD